MKKSMRFPLLVLALLLFFSSVLYSSAEPGDYGLILLQYSKTISLMSRETIKSQGISPTVDTTNAICKDMGGLPVADTAASVQESLSTVFRTYMITPNTNGLATFGAGTAKPSGDVESKCEQKLPTEGYNWDNGCVYRWPLGELGSLSYEGEPGTAFMKGSFAAPNYNDQVLNMYRQFHWNETWVDGIRLTGRMPRGYFSMLLGNYLRRSGVDFAVRMDGPEIPQDENPVLKSMYVILCEYQMYKWNPETTTKMPQPSFIRGYKEDTWAQRHWWVIYLIITVVLLAILVAVIVYCSCTNAPEEVGEPIHNMVIRERVGTAYVTLDQDNRRGSSSKDDSTTFSAQD